MAFGFFKDKSKEPLEVTCPLCQHRQQESRLAVSSYCKSCSAYLTFDKSGEVKARATLTPDPFAHRPPQPKVEIDYKAREEPPLAPAKPTPAQVAPPQVLETEAPISETEEKDDSDEEPESPAEELMETETPTSTPPTQPTSSAPAPAPAPAPATPVAEPLPPSKDESPIPRYHSSNQSDDTPKKGKIVTRDVTCFECGDTHPANVNANSTQCRSCGRLISMLDRQIKEPFNSSIQTRGNVHIHKKGSVLGASIQCHSLTVEGGFSGTIECAGDLTLRRHANITGTVVCKRLRIERRAKIEFHNTVEMDECLIDGLVTGDLVCRGLLALEKRATLTGNIKVGRLTVADGAKHTGQIQMGGF